MYAALLKFTDLYVNMLLGRQMRKGQTFVLHLANDVMILVEGKAKLGEKELEGPVGLVTMPTSKSEKVRIKVESDCIMLEGERKLL